MKGEPGFSGINMQKFNKETIAKSQIIPLMESLMKLCNQEQIPLFATIVTKNSPEETTYESVSLSPDVLGLDLKENNFPKFINVVNGFDTVPPRTILEIEYDV